MILKYPQWQEPLAAAILEFNAQQLRGKVQRAEEVITYRMKEPAVVESGAVLFSNFGPAITD